MKKTAPAKGTEPSKKTEAKQKAKVVEDKTFGLKNKNKSSKVQKYIIFLSIQIFQSQVRASSKDSSINRKCKGMYTIILSNQFFCQGGEQKKIADEFKAKEEKKKELEQKALLSALFKSVSAI